MLLYHATYAYHLKSILERGLGNTSHKNWSFSEPRTVCLHMDPDAAESFPETATLAPSYVYDSGIVTLCVDSKDLDPELLGNDLNLIDDENAYCYHGVIPASDLKALDIDGIPRPIEQMLPPEQWSP